MWFTVLSRNLSAVDYKNRIGGIMVSMLASSVAARRFIGGVMVSMLASSVAARRFNPQSIKPKTIKLVFVASSLSTKH